MTAFDTADWINRYQLVWDRQSRDSSESMPLCGGEVGLNVWVEDNELLVYIAQIGSRDENGALLKTGRLRIRLDPSPFENEFRQILSLKDSSIRILGSNGFKGRLWVEMQRPVIHWEMTCDEALHSEIHFEYWRIEDKLLENTPDKHGSRGMCMANLHAAPVDLYLRKDSVGHTGEAIRFHHRVEGNGALFEFLVRQQQLEKIRDRLWNPLRNLAWGGFLQAEDHINAGQGRGSYAGTPFRSCVLQSKTARHRHEARVILHRSQTETLEQWDKELSAKASDPVDKDSVKKEHKEWWAAFWKRGGIIINQEAGPEDPAWRSSRNYQLSRYLLASNLTGNEASSFNGGLFTFDPAFNPLQRDIEEPPSPDHRWWGPGLTAQNQRLLAFPLLKSGDADLLPPMFALYLNGFGNAMLRTRHYWGHDGCSFNEQPSNLALPGGAIYRYEGQKLRQRPEGMDPGVEASPDVGRNYHSQLEYAWLALQMHQYFDTDMSDYMPFIFQAVTFYWEHYQYQCRLATGKPFDEQGKLRIHPSNALETHPDALNPTEVIAGLTAVLTRLLALPEALVPRHRHGWLANILEHLPPYPIAGTPGSDHILPADGWPHHHRHSSELYLLYPYELEGIGLNKTGLRRMQRTFDCVPEEQSTNVEAWSQFGIHRAKLGRTEEAMTYHLRKFADGPLRFPAFYMSGDYCPDLNWCGTAMLGLQEMLLQTQGDKLILFPAWPLECDVHFKLHAPGQVIVECKLVEGTIKHLVVSPPEARSKIVLPVGE